MWSALGLARDVERVACCPTCSCRRRAARSRAGSRRVPLPSRVRRPACARPRARARAPSPIAVPPSATSRSSASLTGAAVGRRRDALLGEVGERDEPEPERRRAACRSASWPASTAARQPVGLDVGGVHRARDVGDHHHRRRALRRGDRALRPRERDDERAEREQQQQRRQVAAPARPRGDEVRASAPGCANARRLARGGGAAATRRPAPPAAAGSSPASRIGSAKLSATGSGLHAAARRRGRGARRAGAAARPRRGAGGRRGRAASRPSVESTTWSAPARRSAAATSSRSGRGGLGEALAHAAAARVRRAAGGRSPGRRARGRRPAASSMLARVADLDREHAVARAQRAQRRPPSRARRGSRRRPRSSPRWRASAAVAAQRGAERGRARAVGLGLARAARPAARAARGGPGAGAATRGSPPPNATHAEPVAAPRRHVADRRARRPRRRRPCAGRRCRTSSRPTRRARSHAVSARSPTCTRTCGSLHARGHVPVDVAHVVARAGTGGSSPARCRRRPAA